MTAPSFSSFPTFDSIPEFDPDEQRSRSSPKLEGKDEKRNRKGEKDKHKRDKRRSEKSIRPVDHSYLPRSTKDDESLKYEEDKQHKETSTVFYSDRKGDHLNVRYGGLHAGDVPKYRLVGGKFCIGSSIGD
jgi:hypothetical protein